MKRNLTLGLCGATAIAITSAVLLRPSIAQTVAAIQPTASEVPEERPAEAAPADGGAVYGLVAAPAAMPEPDPFGAIYAAVDPAQGSLRQLAASVRGAKDDAARAAATEKMQEALNGVFDADMKRREQELASIEARLKVLREQMTRRQAKKGEIIELQSRVLLNEADGLGFVGGGDAFYVNPAMGAEAAVPELPVVEPFGGPSPAIIAQ